MLCRGGFPIRSDALVLRQKGEPAHSIECVLETRQSMKATILDLRYRMKDVLRAIDRGEPVTVLFRGKEKARLPRRPLNQ